MYIREHDREMGKSAWPRHSSRAISALSYDIAYDRWVIMKTITAREARTNLYKLIDVTALTSEPVQITGMRESIRKGMKTPMKKCLESLDW
jgi:hypothetical protein